MVLNKQKAMAYYWTLPVGWLDVDRPDKHDIKKAVRQSRTIAWQREAIMRWVQVHGYDLVREEVYVEARPDRVSPANDASTDKPHKSSEGVLNSLLEHATREKAHVLFVDLAREVGWRHHSILRNFAPLDSHDLPDSERSPFVAVELSDQEKQRFRQHFKDWRDRYNRWLESKEDKQTASGATTVVGLRARTWAEANALKIEGLKYAEIAAELNLRGLRTMTGKAWSDESLRKFLKKYS